eukprot:1071061-Pelagomonas_calceolata.AAC.1
MFKRVFEGERCSLLFDTGASSCLVSEKWVKKAMEKGKPTVTICTLANPISIKVANNEQFSVNNECVGTLLLQRNKQGCKVVYPNRVRQRETELPL